MKRKGSLSVLAALLAVALAGAVVTSCGTTPEKPRWGVSEQKYPLVTVATTFSEKSSFYVIPSENCVVIQSIGVKVAEDSGALDEMRAAVAKYLQWRQQIGDNEVKVSKQIAEIPVQLSFVGGAEDRNDHHLIFSLETDHKGAYFLRLVRADITPAGQTNPGGAYLQIKNEEVAALAQALAQDNILSKANEADSAARKEQTIQQSLQ